VQGCSIGDIYYSDGTCSDKNCYNSAKTAVGVVFMLTSTQGGMPTSAASSLHGRVVNLHDLYAQDDYLFASSTPYTGSYESLSWGTYLLTVSNLATFGTGSVSTSGSLAYALKNNVLDIYDGKGNTQKIIAAASSVSCSYSSGTANYANYCRAPAAEAANAFYPPNISSSDSKVGAGTWYLPAMGELAYLYGIDTDLVTASGDSSGATGTTKTTVNNTLSVLAAKMGNSYAATIKNVAYWSSTAHGYSSSWPLYMNNGHRGTLDRCNTYSVRAVLAF
jgi:hypothetical protein